MYIKYCLYVQLSLCLLDNKKQFYYEFKSNDKISENDFEELEKRMKEVNSSIYVKLLRISGVYFEGNKDNEMINRIYAKAFNSLEELNEYNEFLEEAKLRDHRKIGQELDLFCFSDYVGAGLPLYTPRGTIVKDELQKEIERVCRRYGFQKVSCPSLADISLFDSINCLFFPLCDKYFILNFSLFIWI